MATRPREPIVWDVVAGNRIWEVVMHFDRRLVAAAFAATMVSGVGIAAAPPTAADPRDVDGEYAVNGTFTAMSDGQWALQHQAFHDQPTVLSTWTITSTCATPYICKGTVVSDQGWTAETTFRSGMWYVSRDLEGWQQCPDGSSAVGHQLYKFYRENPTTLAGNDFTVGDSGACGTSLPLSITMPFTLRAK
jgi:hypothetical protein